MSALKKALTRIDTSGREVRSYARRYVGIRTYYVPVKFGVNGTLSRKIPSVERSKTDEKVDSSKFELERALRNKFFFWLV